MKESGARLAAACIGVILAAMPTVVFGDSLELTPSSPTPLDIVSLRYQHTGCTNANSVQVRQVANHISVSVDRRFAVDCGTTLGFFEEFAVGRLPSGEYDVDLIVNPPPGSLAPSQLVGPVHLSVAMLPATGSPHPHDDYTGLWWNPNEPGWALGVTQSSEKLFMVWSTYDDDHGPAWFVVPAGAWSINSDGALHFSGAIYRTTGPSWRAPFDPTAVTASVAGSADFLPQGFGRATFSYVINGLAGSKQVERSRF